MIDATISWFSGGENNYNVKHRDVVSIVASIRGGNAYRGLMIRAFAEALRDAHNIKEQTGKHLDIAQVFYQINSSVGQESQQLSGGEFEQICEMRSTLTKNLSLTQIFNQPNNVNPDDD